MQEVVGASPSQARPSSGEAKAVMLLVGVHSDTIHRSVPTKSQVNSSHGPRLVFDLTVSLCRAMTVCAM